MTINRVFRPINFLVILTVSLFLLSTGCKRVHVPKPSQAPEIVHCCDAVGHILGSKPWLLGGTCCCTPSKKVLIDWQANGCFVGKTVEEVIEMYHEKGIKLALDHKDCNNACSSGPHVVKGGKCMVPPTPGTRNYEEIIFGQMYVETRKAPKEYKKRIPCDKTAYKIAEQSKTQ